MKIEIELTESQRELLYNALTQNDASTLCPDDDPEPLNSALDALRLCLMPPEPEDAPAP